MGGPVEGGSGGIASFFWGSRSSVSFLYFFCFSSCFNIGLVNGYSLCYIFSVAIQISITV